MPNPQAASIIDAFERALGVIRARVFAFSESGTTQRLAVAYSGGLDSAALLHLAHVYAKAHGISLFAFHVHHGISPNADAWLAHCEKECAASGIHFDARRMVLSDRERDGVEQAARTARYAALGELCRQHEVPLLLTAHHQDDQAETVLLQLLRGSGVTGMCGMDALNTAPDLLGDARTLIGRPLLEVTRAELAMFVSQHGIAFVEDESNTDLRYARNALRHGVVPSLDRYFPGFQRRLARAAQHARSAQGMLDELAEQDLASCCAGDAIDIARLQKLGTDRIDNLLRHWFARHGIRMPSTAWLVQMRGQLFEARKDALVCVTHPDCEIRRHRGMMHLVPRIMNGGVRLPPVAFRWNGEAEMPFPAYGGSLHFDIVAEGVDGVWLRAQELHLRHRSGGEKLKLAADRPTKSLKHHFQDLDVPAWERTRLPVVVTGDGKLLYAAGIGMNCRDVPMTRGQAIRLRWEAGAS
ncbi:MAG TPA: tRNA lysidine(34) synthetase TilS [Noviherbaspirillum sp.]|uniref:tRNA lysidine(34) synthetase TilS n=1 Tax=Noviherbaspirillum sp. TaxID=1926288 RepID=UPI002B4A87E7|nr:tRNA lysidine(34) synthetase TilS [Noviherbaspirillum sp.]HJV85800.1 tRNA lysidine(34) synthetase TilS [Noviherbaspirillum sp.]